MCLTNDNSGTGNNANQQAADSGVAAAANAFHWFEIDEGSPYTFYIDGVQVCSISTHFPTANTAVRWVFGGLGTTATAVNLDIAALWLSEDWR